MATHTFSELECPDEIVHICTGQVSSDKVNVDQCTSIGKDQVKSFYECLHNGFYEPLSKKDTFEILLLEAVYYCRYQNATNR